MVDSRAHWAYERIVLFHLEAALIASAYFTLPDLVVGGLMVGLYVIKVVIVYICHICTLRINAIQANI